MEKLRIKSAETVKPIINLVLGGFLGYTINNYFNFNNLIDASANEQIWPQNLLLISFGLILLVIILNKLIWKTWEVNKTMKVVFLGVFLISSYFAIENFYRNVDFFRRGGYSSPNLHVSDLEGNWHLLTFYPPELIFNLIKAVFISSISGFIERVIKS